MEFDLIARIRARASGRADVLLGIGDDAALLQVPHHRVLAVTADTLNIGVHFPAETTPADLGWKALAVNLSDLAAMGAEPAWCTLSLSMPEADSAWLDGFLDGFLELAHMHGVALIGGDTTRGPLSVAITAHGLLNPDAALRRDRACAGDDIWVTGTLGDAAAALDFWQRGEACPPYLRSRLERPSPRIQAGLTVAERARAGIDVSDGLLADLAHICRASALAAEIWLPTLPASPELAALPITAETRWQWQVSGGDDYELCFTAAPACGDEIQARLRKIAVPVTRIGRMLDASTHEVRVLMEDGTRWQPPHTGFVHFSTPPAEG